MKCQTSLAIFVLFFLSLSSFLSSSNKNTVGSIFQKNIRENDSKVNIVNFPSLPILKHQFFPNFIQKKEDYSITKHSRNPQEKTEKNESSFEIVNKNQENNGKKERKEIPNNYNSNIEKNQVISNKTTNINNPYKTPVPEYINNSNNTKINRLGVQDFFHKTSKDNENMAQKALGMFVLGIACFILSIHLICWNERRAVKEAEFTDYISKEKKCISVSNGVKLEAIDNNKVYLISGNLEIKDSVQIPGLDLEFSYGGNRTILIRYEVDKFSIITSENRSTEYRNGEEYEVVRNTTQKIWLQSNDNNSKYSCQTYSGNCHINGIYKVDVSKLENLVHSHQTASLSENKYIHIFKESDENLLSSYFKKDSNLDLPIKVFCYKDCAYIIRNNSEKITKDNFNPDSYNFSEDDRRLKIKYFYTPPTFDVTAVGKLQNTAGGGYEFTAFPTNIKKPACHYFCCCCAESNEFYTVDLLYDGARSRDDIVTKLINDNDNSTWILRLCGFLLHFIGYYGILYPFIMLIGMIPFLGAVGATILIFIAFFLACITFLFIIACAWICARPILAILIFGFLFFMIFLGKTAEGKMKDSGMITDPPQDINNNGNGSNASKRNFLGFY